MRRHLLLAFLGIAVMLAVWGNARGIDSWRHRTRLYQARARIPAGLPAAARQLLADSAARWSGDGEVAFLLGSCEQVLGRPEAAEGRGRVCCRTRTTRGTRP